ncbi:MAG: hypothetical protein MJY99_11025 [Fibrobacter sp.]|nr:hypothetical protein [Fibrobacter sp.]
MIKVSRLVLAALFLLLFSGMSFAVDVDPCASWPVTLEEDADGFYEIGSADALYKFACMVNNGATNISGKLTADICLNACKEGESVLKANGTLSDNASNFTQWTPIGTSEKPYTGTFDGNGHTIRGLYVNDGDAEYVGLFGYIDESAKVQNVGVDDSYFKGCQYVGGVVGYNYNGTVSNVYNTGSVSGETFVGGVVGKNEGSVSNVYNTGSVSESGNDVGGVVGNNFGTVSNAYNTGSVSGSGDDVGGVVGYSFNGTVSNVYNTGSVSGNGVGVGGVVGNNYGTVSNAYYNTDFYAGNAVGEGDASGANVEGKTTLELASKTLPNGFDENVWVAGSISIGDDGSVTFGLPYLNGQSSQLTFKLEMDVNKYLEISTALQLKLFAQLVNSGETNINGKLTADICLNACKEGDKPLLEQIAGLGENGDISTLGFNQWTPMNVQGGVQVTLNGNGKTISGLYFNDENQDNVGLFGEVYGTVSVSNLGIRDSYFRGESCVGGLVGYNNNGTLTITNSYNAGTVSGRGVYVGGLVGNNNGENVRLTITNSYNAGTVSGSDGSICIGGLVGVNGGKNAKLTITNSYNAGSVSGGDDVGGLVGVNGGEKAMLTITNSYNAGTVSRGDDSYEVGGLVGYENGGTWIITNSFFLAAGGNGDGLGGELKAFLDDFHNGTVAKELHDWCEMDGETCKEGGLNGSIWGQDLAAENSLPDFSGVVGFKYGSITFFNLNDDVADSASIDATAKAPVSILKDIAVSKHVTFKRPFAVGYSTMMLPFSVSEENLPDGLEFYSFGEVEEINGKYTASYISVTGLNAHTPYIVKNSGEDALSQVTFEGEFTLGTSVMPPPNSSSSAWKFNGTYEYKTWEEGDAGLGRTYGFAANDGVNDTSIVGKFAKVGAGAYIYPMRAYLEYTAPAALARPAANGEIRTVASLPDEIDVVIVDKDEKTGEQTTKVIGTINTRTGEFKFANDRWFDLNGRYLGSKKPTQKGAYYNNGKKVIVK